jgi:hypothetical protein
MALSIAENSELISPSPLRRPLFEQEPRHSQTLVKSTMRSGQLANNEEMIFTK